MLMSAGIGAGFAGAAFYAYYDNRLAENEEQVAGFVETFDTQFADAALAIEGQRDGALEDLRAELLPLEAYVIDTNGVATLPDSAGPAVWSIRSFDDDGRATAGTAFALVAHEGGSGLITELDIVRSSTVTPAPPIELVKGDRVLQATLWTWDEANGLALVVTSEMLPLLELAEPGPSDSLVGRSVSGSWSARPSDDSSRRRSRCSREASLSAYRLAVTGTARNAPASPNAAAPMPTTSRTTTG